MNLVKGSLIALVAFCAGFVAAMLAEPYIPGRAQAYRYEIDSLEKENDRLKSLLQTDNQQREHLDVPEASGPAPVHPASPGTDGAGEQRSP